eukprot:543584_1
MSNPPKQRRRRGPKTTFRKNSKNSIGSTQGRTPQKQRQQQKNNKHYDIHKDAILLAKTKKNYADKQIQPKNDKIEQQYDIIKTQQKKLDEYKDRADTMELKSVQNQDLCTQLDDIHDTDYNIREDMHNHNQKTRAPYDMEYVLEILNISQYASSLHTPDVLKGAAKIFELFGIDAKNVRIASSGSCAKWDRVLRRIFCIYQIAFEFQRKDGIFSGDKNCNIRDCGSTDGKNLFSNSVSARDEKKLKYMTLGMGQLAGKSTELYITGLLGNINDINCAIRDLFEDIDECYTVLNQIISNLTDGLKQEECVTAGMDEHRSDGKVTYHFKGWQHNIGRVVGDENGGLICALILIRSEQTDCTFEKSGMFGLQKTCDYFSPGSLLCKPTKKTQSLIAFIEKNVNYSLERLNKIKFQVSQLKKFPIARPANATILFGVLWCNKDIILKWIETRKVIYRDQYIILIERYLKCEHMQRVAFFWSAFAHGYILPF